MLSALALSLMLSTPIGDAVKKVDHTTFTVAQAPTDKGELVTHLFMGSYVIASAMDLATTMWCRGAKTCTEANVFLKPFQDSPLTFAAVKTGAAVAIELLLVKFHKEHPKLVRAASAILTSAHTAVAVNNWRSTQRK